MSAQASLITALKADATITAQVATGSPLVYRIYNAVAPDGPTYPFITYQVITDAVQNQLSGAKLADFYNVQITCWANDPMEAWTLSDYVETALLNNGYVVNKIEHDDPEAQKYAAILDWSFIE